MHVVHVVVLVVLVVLIVLYHRVDSTGTRILAFFVSLVFVLRRLMLALAPVVALVQCWWWC